MSALPAASKRRQRTTASAAAGTTSEWYVRKLAVRDVCGVLTTRGLRQAAALAGRAAPGDVGAGEGVQATGAGHVHADLSLQGMRVAGAQGGVIVGAQDGGVAGAGGGVGEHSLGNN